MAFTETDDAQPEASGDTVDFDGLPHVFGASGMEAAGGGQPRRDQLFVSAESRDTD